MFKPVEFETAMTCQVAGTAVDCMKGLEVSPQFGLGDRSMLVSRNSNPHQGEEQVFCQEQGSSKVAVSPGNAATPPLPSVR